MSISDLGIVPVVAIVVICYMIGFACSAYEKIPNKVIPVVMGICGAILGGVGMYVIPDFPAQDILNAIAVGIVSGLSATGINQIYKQLTKDE